MTVTIYQPAQPVQIEINEPVCRASKPFYYRVYPNGTTICVRLSEFSSLPPSVSLQNSCDGAFDDKSYEISESKFYEVLSSALYKIGLESGIEMHELKQTTSEDDRFVEMQEDRREWAEERRQGREIY